MLIKGPPNSMATVIEFESLPYGSKVRIIRAFKKDNYMTWITRGCRVATASHQKQEVPKRLSFMAENIEKWKRQNFESQEFCNNL